MTKYVVNGLVLVALILAPFAAYKAVKLAGRSDSRRWPATVVLIGTNADQLEGLSLLRIQSPLRIDFPITSSLTVPSGGTLRASTVLKIGGPKMLADSLAATLSISDEYYAVWDGSIGGSLPTKTDLGARVSDVEGTLATQSLVKLAAPGRNDSGPYFNTYDLDATTLTSMLASQSPQDFASVAPSPSPSGATLNPATISIEVINQGGKNGAGTKLVQTLQRKGFSRTHLGPAANGTVLGNYVFFSKSRFLANIVLAAIGVPAKIANTPSTYNQTVDVVVLLGAPTPTPQTSH